MSSELCLLLQEATYFFITTYNCDEECAAAADENHAASVYGVQGHTPFCQGPLVLQYKLEMTNGPNSWRLHHFSADEARRCAGGSTPRAAHSLASRRPQIGVLQLYICTSCILFVFAVQTFRIMRGLQKKKK